MKLKFLVILLLFGGLCLFTAVANADIIAEFEDAGTAGVDTVPGALGDGWRGAWNLNSSGTGSKSRVLGTSDPLYVDSNNYLDAAISDTGADGYSCSLNRRYYLTSLNDDYYISYSIRFDDLSIWTDLDETNGNTSDRFYLSNTSAADYSHQTTRTGWAIRVCGNNATEDYEQAYQFRFLSSATGPGSTSSEYSGADVTVQEDHVYRLVVAVHNGNHTYEATVTDETTGKSYTSSTLNMEAQINADYLYFGTEHRNQGGSTLAYSVDNVVISNTAPVMVPEPSTLVLLAGALVGLLVWRKRK